MTDISSQTLHIVAKELSATLNDARASLEAYAERPDQRVLLEKCADQLHSAHGVLRLVEVYGAALLAEEMEHVTRYLLNSGSDQKRQIDGLDALMRAMVQLPTYLERVLSGGRDLALVLLPLLNDLRSVRGSPLLSEGTLLLLNLKSDQNATPQSLTQGEQSISVAQWARRLRPRFQIGLLGYIRGERTVQNLEILAKVTEKLEQVATTQPVFQLWWVVGAILEAVRANGLEGSATLKRLLGQADRQIKALYELGEGRYCEDPPIDLLNNLLYYVARATTSGGRIAAVRASFKLAELLPVDDNIEQERESLSAPSVKLMRTVAAAIKEDLSKVKDVLDIFVRRGGGQSSELQPQLELLKKISDTLGVLGLGELRQRVQEEIQALAQIVQDGKPPSEDSLVRVAGVLLSVEDSLDDQLIRLILPAPSTAGSAEVPPDQDHEFRQVSEAVLRECIVNLARIKEAVSTAVQKPNEFSPQGLDNVPQLLRGITAGLLMLGKGRAVELMDAVGTQVRKLIEPGAPPPDPIRLERVADAIVSIEYYMETVQNGRTDPWYMLDNAEMCLKTLVDDDTLSRVPNLALTSSEAAKTMKLDPADTIAMERTKRAHAATNPLIAVPEPEAVDPQFVELFIEEAKEEIASVQKAFPSWDVHRGSEGRNRVGSKGFPLVGSKPHGSGGVVFHAAQLSYLERQRTHGRRALDGGIRLVHRESAESDHRQNPDAHAGNDGAAAQFGGGIAATGGTTGDRTTRFHAHRDADGTRVCLCRWPRSGAGKGQHRAGRSRRIRCEQRDSELGGRGRGSKTGHGRRAARHLLEGDLQSFDGDPRIPAQAVRPARAARTAGVGVSGHPYFERQLQDGGGAPRHSHHRAAESCDAQGVRQRTWPVGRRARDARTVGACH